MLYQISQNCFYQDDIKLFNLDTIVRDGMNTIVPCSAEPPESAPSGAYLCNVSEAICLEKWNVSKLPLSILWSPILIFHFLGSQLWNHKFWQYSVCDADCISMHYYGGMDQHVVLGEETEKYISLPPDTNIHLWIFTELRSLHCILSHQHIELCCTYWQQTLFVLTFGSGLASIANNSKDTVQKTAWDIMKYTIF